MTNSEGGTDDEEFRNAAVVDRVNTTLQVWMGLTMECAQCHTHKYDPIKQEEYYKFIAILNQPKTPTAAMKARTSSPSRPTTCASKSGCAARSCDSKKSLRKSWRKRPATTARRRSHRGPLKTRYVRVEMPGQGVYLHLAEVQAFAGDKNVALTGNASQISTDYDGPAKFANDGNTDGNYQAKSVSHTASSTDPWWEVDLGSPQVLDRIVLWNRTDGGTAARLHDFRVIALDEERQPLWVKTTAASPIPSVEFALPASADKLTDDIKVELARYVTGGGERCSPNRSNSPMCKSNSPQSKGCRRRSCASCPQKPAV